MAATEEVGTLWIRSHNLHPGREGAVQEMGEHTFTHYNPNEQTFTHFHRNEQTFTHYHPNQQILTHYHPFEQIYVSPKCNAKLAGAEERALARD